MGHGHPPCVEVTNCDSAISGSASFELFTDDSPQRVFNSRRFAIQVLAYGGVDEGLIPDRTARLFGDLKESLHDVLIEADRDLYLSALGLLFGDDPPLFPFAEIVSMGQEIACSRARLGLRMALRGLRHMGLTPYVLDAIPSIGEVGS